MWYIILLVVIAATAAGLIYLSLRLSRFGFMEKFGRNRPKCRKFIGFFIVILIFTALSLTINLMNAVVCLLHFVVFWILSDLVFGLIEHLRKKRFKHYYAGICAVLLSLISLSAGWYLNHNVRATVYHLETVKKSKICELSFSPIPTSGQLLTPPALPNICTKCNLLIRI